MFPLFLLIATLVPTGHVNDFAHILKPETVSNLESTLANFESTTGNEIAIVTIDTHGSDETIESYAVKLFEKWGIGKENEDNGLLLLVSRDDREMRIEVGYGLEPVITDIESGRIIREVLTPAFQAGDYDGGIIAAVEKLIEKIRLNEPGAVEEPHKSIFPQIIFLPIFLVVYAASLLAPSKSWWFGGVLGAIFGAIYFFNLIGIAVMTVFGLLLDFFVSRNYKKDKWKNGPPWLGGGGIGGGKGAGGFGGFGGGMSGGGGASGRW